jgi:hypothetical protein
LKEQMLHTFAEVHENLLMVATIVERQAIPHKEYWGPREVLAHIAAWEAEALHRIPLIAAGAPAKKYDADEFNSQALAAINGQSFKQVHHLLCQTHQQLVSMLILLEDRHFVPGGSAHEWISALIQHCDEHVLELAKRV